MKDIFQFEDYKIYLKEALIHLGHGSRLRLSQALNCQSAYVSQVLNQGAHFSLEQAADAAAFLSLDRDEEDYFFLLVQFAKAGTERLRLNLKSKIKIIKEKRVLLSNRVTNTHYLDEATQARYYSRWYYAGIHMLVTIPSFRHKEAMAKYLGLPIHVVNDAIEFLLSVGLLSFTPDGYETGKTRVFLKGDSPFIVQHHENWRGRALHSVTMGQKENLHFSSVYSLSRSDLSLIREKLLGHLQEVREIVRPSKEEEVCVLNLDFFSLNQKPT